jgi:recombination protein RecA
MAAKKRTTGVDSSANDDLSRSLIADLNKLDIDSYTLGDEWTPTDLNDWIGTGSSLLDLAISNRPNGGIPVGRIVELSGLEGSGKSLICAHLLANVQKLGGVAVLIDTETAVNEEFYEAVGIDMDKLVYVHENIVEKIFEAIEKIVERVRQASANNDKRVIIVVDSIANALPKVENEGTFDKQGFGTQKAYLIGQGLRKLTKIISKQRVLLVFTNQLRYNMQPGSHEKWITPGGKALPFISSLRVRLTQMVKITKTVGAEKHVIGVTIEAHVLKNRFGPPYRKVKFDVYFDRGIDDVSSWLKFMNDNGITTGASGNYTYVDSNGEEFKFKTAGWKKFIEEHPEQFEEMYTKICTTMVMMYKSDDVNTLDGSAETEIVSGETED